MLVWSGPLSPIVGSELPHITSLESVDLKGAEFKWKEPNPNWGKLVIATPDPSD